ncbi:MAG: GH1 family beta-glucosidase [Meiothermus sp.]|uniref:GH1 family beta-glucosidase n=1 Tax=Meiothermus sp. TaxID=1955249 RepID=UPI0025E2627F|nr:GH1 family beta-glucosidase [Meiothermus sp.]MCS7058152.1 GH1 family beta-glucosidase [Meiothermus sp.]MCS7193333.1 GH1 family beta-glucosidase [Meiothermus sp.]MDW8091227.1 GH1 family beta-glucosidase [Meiothermus sp.]MDW8481987.1 GH1 family beta-glucosidase [Meiothermus sp.]
MELRKADFGPQFRWGVATAAYQIEGAVKEDGRGPSIWDTFAHTPGRIKTGENADVACDFYHRYREDTALIREMNFQAHRFSLAWPRILPEGRGRLNPKGLDFYQRVIDRTLELGLEPWVTLYHWDLPQALEDQGGWTNRDVVGWFAEYAAVCARAFGDRVRHWMVLNEPAVFTVLGYLQGRHAPGRRGLSSFLPAVHHAALAQAEGGRALRASLPNAQIGTTFSASYVQAAGPTWLSQMAATQYDAIANRLFLEPALGLGYPWKRAPFLHLLRPYIRPGDLERLAFDFDFIGLQTYFRQLVRFDPLMPATWAREVPHEERGGELTAMGWEVWPENLYHLLKQFAAYPGVRRIIITENGVAYLDTPEGGRVHDPKRIAFIQAHLLQVRRAQQEGVPVEGYFYWSLMDNFEWAEGYRPRFGLVYVDYATQKRILKDSALWFREFLG